MRSSAAPGNLPARNIDGGRALLARGPVDGDADAPYEPQEVARVGKWCARSLLRGMSSSTQAVGVTLEQALASGRVVAERCLFVLTEAEVAGAREAIPPRLREAITEFVSSGNDLGFFLVRGLPIDALDGLHKTTSISEEILIAAASCVGTPFGYQGQRDGAVIQDLWPVREHRYLQIGTSSCELQWHVDDAHAPIPPDYLAILCLRGDPGAVTLVSRVDDGALAPEVRARLRQPAFTIRADSSHAEDADMAEDVPVLAEDGLRYDPLFTTCTSDEHASALAELGEQINARAVGVVLDRGDLLLIDNRRAVHARTAFVPRFDDTDRWVQRTAILTKEVPEDMVFTRTPLQLRSRRQEAEPR